MFVPVREVGPAVALLEAHVDGHAEQRTGFAGFSAVE